MHAIVEHAALVMLVLSGIPLLAIAVGGGIISLMQAMLQVQEQSVLHLTKVSVLAAVCAVGGEWAFHEVERLFLAILSFISAVREL